MAKSNKRYEQAAFGRKLIYVDGTVSVINEAVCQNPTGEAAIVSARLYALTNLLTGEAGHEVFDSLTSDDQQSIFDILYGLAAETAALTQMARDLGFESSSKGLEVMGGRHA